MKLTIDYRMTDGSVELGLTGKLLLGDETRYLGDTIKAAVADGNKSIVLDLSELAYIDSAGLGTLITGFKTVTNAGGDIKLRGLNGGVHSTLVTTKLLTVFEVIENPQTSSKSTS
jgi:anti-sigma B factor antagonist